MAGARTRPQRRRVWQHGTTPDHGITTLETPPRFEMLLPLWPSLLPPWLHRRGVAHRNHDHGPSPLRNRLPPHGNRSMPVDFGGAEQTWREAAVAGMITSQPWRP